MGINTINGDNTLTPTDPPEVHDESRREPRDADHHEQLSLPVRYGGRRPQQAGGAPHGLHGDARRRHDQEQLLRAAEDRQDDQSRQPHVAPDDLLQGRVRPELRTSSGSASTGPSRSRGTASSWSRTPIWLLPDGQVPVGRDRARHRPQCGRGLQGRQRHRDPRCPHRQRDECRRAGRLLRVLQPHDRYHAHPREQAEHRHGAQALYNMRITSYREVCNTPPC